MSHIQEYNLTIDPIGKYRLIIGDQLAFSGPSSKQESGCIQLRGELSERAATVIRQEDGYHFTTSNSDKPQKIDQESWELAPGLTMNMTVPSRLTQTMVISVKPSSRMIERFNHILLFDQFLLLGQGPKTHIQHPLLPPLSALIQRHDYLEYRSPITVDSQRGNQSASILKPGETIQIGDCFFLLELIERNHSS